MRTRVKVCGMTRAEDIEHAVVCGADAIGFILHAKSKRLIELEQAAELRRRIPAFMNVVGVFVDASRDFILECAREIGLDLIQLHGDESLEFADSLELNYIKALRTKTKDQVINAATQFSNARALLLDPFVEGQHGGTGQLLPDHAWPSEPVDVPLVLAGGLSPSNIAEKLNQYRPFAVDINSGVEAAPGIKDPHQLRECILAVRQFDSDRLDRGIKLED